MNKNILKWAGSKIRLMPELLSHLPEGDLLIEPFTGSAAVFMNTNYKKYVLGDSNDDLMQMYINVTLSTEEFISRAKNIFKLGGDVNYRAFREVFNQTRGDLSVARSVTFLYLNRHCFNGLCRYNKKGEFNVPHGEYKSVYFPEDEIRLFAEKVRDTNTRLVKGDFKKTIKDHAAAGAVIYCDPPYLPASETANFSQYNAAPFGVTEHQELVTALIAAQRSHGVKVVISGSDTEETRRIYKPFSLDSVSVNRSVSANVITRGAVKEVIGVLGGC